MRAETLVGEANGDFNSVRDVLAVFHMRFDQLGRKLGVRPHVFQVSLRVSHENVVSNDDGALMNTRSNLAQIHQ